MIAGGMAITILNEMADALSTIPTLRTCSKKNFTTSYKGIPWKPGRRRRLLHPITIVTGAEEANTFFVARKIFIMALHVSLYFENPVCSAHPGIPGRISY